MAELATVARPYAEAAFRLGLEGRNLAQWSDMLAMIARLREVPGLDLALTRVTELPLRMFGDGESAVVSALLAALKLAVALFDVQGRRAGRVDFTSFALAAEDALGAPEEPSDLALQLDYRLQHLLGEGRVLHFVNQ